MSKDGSDGRPQQPIVTDIETWKRSDRYHNERLIGTPDVSLLHAVESSAKAGLPNIAVSEAQVRCLLIMLIVLLNGRMQYHRLKTFVTTGQVLTIAGTIYQGQTDSRGWNVRRVSSWIHARYYT